MRRVERARKPAAETHKKQYLRARASKKSTARIARALVEPSMSSAPIPDDNATVFTAWANVEPLASGEADDSPARIAYPPEYARLQGLLRACLARGETSARALALAGAVIRASSAFYSAWQLRRDCVAAAAGAVGDAGAAAELDFCDAVLARGSTKNYQVWHHRRWAASRLGPEAAARELELTAALLLGGSGGSGETVAEDDDSSSEAKNYHVWSHRQWVCAAWGVWEAELGLVDTLLAQDVRNNSAWNHRWFVQAARARGTPPPGRTSGIDLEELPVATLSAVAGNSGPLPDSCIPGELSFVLPALRRAWRNESAWAYLRALLASPPSGAAVIVNYPFALHGGSLPLPLRSTLDTAVAEALAAACTVGTPNAFALEFAADLAVGDAVAGLGQPAALREAAARMLDECVAADEVRAAFWTWRASLVRNLIVKGA